jgi:hypothetical protein
MNKMFLTREYQLSHGRMPRGRGTWAFAPQGQRDNMDAWVWINNATYGEAKRKLPAGTWIVLP